MFIFFLTGDFSVQGSNIHECKVQYAIIKTRTDHRRDTDMVQYLWDTLSTISAKIFLET